MTVRVAAVQNDPRGFPTEDFRLSTATFQPSETSGLHGYAGVLPAPPGWMGEVTLLGPEVIQVNPGRWVIPGTQSGVQGDYIVVNDASVERAIAPRDASLSRIDRLVVQVRDTAYTPNEGVNEPDVRVLPGVPALSGPTAPALPPNAVHLGLINVPTTGGTVTFTPSVLSRQVAVGGVQPLVLNDPRLASPGAYDGQLRDHPSWGLQRWTAASGSWDDVIIDRIRTLNAQDVSPTSTGHPLQLGPDNASNLAMDSNQITSRDAGKASWLTINSEIDSDGRYGDVTIGSATVIKGGTAAGDGSQFQALLTNRLRVLSANDAQQREEDNTGTPSILHPFQIGTDDQQHVIIDTNEGMARTALTGVTGAAPAGTGGGKVAPFIWRGLQVLEPALDAEPVRRGTLNGSSSLANQTAWQNMTLSNGFSLISGGPGARWVYMNGVILFSVGIYKAAGWAANTAVVTWNTTWRPRYDQYFTVFAGGQVWGECKIEASTGVMAISTPYGGGSGTISFSGSFVPNVVI